MKKKASISAVIDVSAGTVTPTLNRLGKTTQLSHEDTQRKTGRFFSLFAKEMKGKQETQSFGENRGRKGKECVREKTFERKEGKKQGRIE